MRVLITGGQGFIGVALTRELRRQGNSVTSYDLKEGNRGGADEVLNGSILDGETIYHVSGGFDAIVHAACMLGVERTDANPLETMDVIIEGTRNILRCCDVKKTRLVYLSSSEVYGDPPADTILHEHDTPQPITPYAIAKLCAEQYVRTYKGKWSIVRPFNVYGPGQSDNFVIPSMLKRALAGEFIPVYGDGSQVRSFCYIDDFIRGLTPIAGGRADGHVVNLGRNDPISMWGLAEKIQDRVVKNVKAVRTPYEYSDRTEEREIRYRAPNISWARSWLNYSPDTTMYMGLTKMIDALKKKEVEA